MELIIIAAMAKNRVIGKGGAIPWHIPEELRRFKRLTMGHCLVMGRKTHESIGRPLPGRNTVVISRDPAYRTEGCRTATSLGEAIALCHGAEKIFIAGGGEIYRQALPMADAIYLSILDREVAGDVLFPEFEQERFKLLSSERGEGPEPYGFRIYQRVVA